jgi:hypothetical protein
MSNLDLYHSIHSQIAGLAVVILCQKATISFMIVPG